jgi:hypothetical protein
MGRSAGLNAHTESPIGDLRRLKVKQCKSVMQCTVHSQHIMVRYCQGTEFILVCEYYIESSDPSTVIFISGGS